MAQQPDPFLSALDDVQREAAGADPFLAALDEVQADTQTPADQRSLGARAFDAVFTAPEFITKPAAALADWIDEPAADRSVLGGQVRGFIGGAIQGAADLLTPGDAVLTATGYGPLARVIRGVRGGAQAVDALQRGANVATAARGVERVADTESLPDAAAGVAQVALGAAGVRSGEQPQIGPPEPKALPSGRFVAGADGVAVPGQQRATSAQRPVTPVQSRGEVIPAAVIGYADDGTPIYSSDSAATSSVLQTRRERPALPPARTSFVAGADGAVASVDDASLLAALDEVQAAAAPAPSGGRTVRAAVASYDAQGQPVYSSDPEAVGVTRPVRGELPPGPRFHVDPTGRTATAEQAGELRRQLDDAQRTQPAASGGRLTRPAVLDRDIDATVPARDAVRVRQYASDPDAVDAPFINDEQRRQLERMRADLDIFTPQRGRLVRGEGEIAANTYARGGAGSPVGDDIRVISEQNVGNADIAQAIDDLLDGKAPTNRLHTAALDAAQGYIEGRGGYRGPNLPMEAMDDAWRVPDDIAADDAVGAGVGVRAASGGGAPAQVDDFDAFSRIFDDVEPGSVRGGREPGEEGSIAPLLAARMGGAAAGGAAGAATGETPEERAAYGVGGAVLGALAPTAARRLLTKPEQAAATRAIGRVVNKRGEMVAAYRARFGNVISADNAKEIISPEYGKSVQSRREFGRAVHPASVRMFDALVDDVARRPATDKPVVLVVGAPGAGKTAALSGLPLHEYEAVIETSMRNPASSRALIDKLANSGRRVRVVVVDRDVRDSWANGVLTPRRVEEGRITPLDYHIAAHQEVPETVARLAYAFADDSRVSFRVIRNDAQGTRDADVSTLRNRSYNAEDVARTLRADTERLIAEGRLPADVADAAFGRGSRSDRGAGQSRARRGDPSGEVTRPPDDSGFITTQLASHVGGGAAGAAYGAASGEDDADRLKRAALFGLAGAAAPSLLRRGGASTAGRAADAQAGAAGTVTPGAGPRGIVSGPARTGRPRTDPMDGMDVFIGKFNPLVQSGIRERIVANGGYDVQRRGTIDSRTLGRFANDVRINVEKTLPRGTALNAESITAYARAVQQTQGKIQELAQRVSAGTASDADVVALQAARADADVLTKSLAGARSEAGRSLAAFRFLGAVLETGDVNLIRGVADSMRDDARKLAEGLAQQPNDPLLRYRWLQKQGTPTLWEKARSVYYANILSGVKTHERNILGNVANIASELAVTPFAAAADAVRSRVKGTPRTVYLDELPSAAVGAIGGVERAFHDALFTLRHGVSPDSLRRSISAGEAGKLDVPRVEFAGGVANPFNWPGRALDSADAFFRSVARNKELYQLAHAHAKREGLTGERFVQRVADLRSGTAPESQALLEQAAEYARRSVFQEKPGRFASWVMQGHNVPVIGHVMPFVLPFVKTPANIFRQGLEFSPAGVLMKAARQGGRAGAQAQGRAVAGSLAAGYLAWLAATGRLSGDGPTNAAERAALMESGWRPNSVRIGDQWVSYQLFQPVSVQAAIIANAYDAWRSAGSKPQDVSDVLAQTLARSANSFTEQSFFSGLFDFIAALKDPERSASRLAARTAQSMVPFVGALRSVQQAVDPVVRQPRGATETFKAGLPGLSDDVEPRIDRRGAVVMREGGELRRAADPFNVASVVADPVAQEIDRLTPIADSLGLQGWPLGLPSDNYSSDGAPLSRGEETELKSRRGSAVWDALTREIEREGYERLTDEQKARRLDRAIDRARQGASSQFRRTVVQRRAGGEQDAPITSREVEYQHPRFGRVRVVGEMAGGNVRVAKVLPGGGAGGRHFIANPRDLRGAAGVARTRSAAGLKFAEGNQPMTAAEIRSLIPEMSQIAGRAVTYAEMQQEARSRGIAVR